MKIFTEKGIVKKLILIFVVVMIFNAVIPSNISFAAQDNYSWGGVLLKPISDLLLAIGDFIMDIIHNVLFDMNTSLIRIDKDNGWWEKVAITLAVIAAIALIAVASVALAGAALKVVGAIAAKIGVTVAASKLSAAAVGTFVVVALGGGAAAGIFVRSEFFADEIVMPIYRISPEEIFAGEIRLLNVNFFNAPEVTGEDDTTTLGMELRPTIAKWYYAIRNFALIAMMVILVYIGIRMMITGVSSEKAKYKSMLTDWVVAVCLIFIMHYIMAFSMNIVDGITKIFASVEGDNQYVEVYEYSNNINKALNEAGVDTSGMIEVVNGEKVINWDAKNLLGIARVQAALNNAGTTLYLGWGMCYLILVLYTVFFLFTYLKRALYLTFFTIIAPLVAMTYPLDKLHDGKAQAFDMWIREYIFNLMIQPVHLLLYTVFISSAFELASTNILYSLTAIGFMMPAEKFLRKMFGFDKAQTPGFLSGAAGTALMVTAFNKMFHRKPSKGGKDDNGNGSNSGGDEGQGKFREVDPSLLGQSTGSPTGGGPTGGGPTGGGPTGGGPRRRTRRTNSSGFVKKQFRGFKNASKEWANQKLNRAAKSIADGKPIKTIAKTAGGLYLGAGGAVLGATFALADDEPIKKMGQYAPTLGAAGYALGAQNIKPNYNTDDVHEEYQRGLYDTQKEYDEAKMKEEIDKMIDNQKNQRKIRDNLRLDSIKEAKERMEQYRKSLESGITNMDDLSTIMNLVEDGQMDEDMAIVASKYYKKAGGKPKNMAENSKEKEHITHVCTNIAKKTLGPSATQAQVDQSVKIMLNNLDLYGSYKDKLTEV